MDTRTCATGIAFIGFSMSLIIGLIAQNDYITVVGRALAVMGLFYIIGSILSIIGQKVVQENFDNEVLAAEHFGDEMEEPDMEDQASVTEVGQA